jgi:hypothetical protein
MPIEGEKTTDKETNTEVRREDNNRREKSAPEQNVNLPSGTETRGLLDEANKAHQPQDTAYSDLF